MSNGVPKFLRLKNLEELGIQSIPSPARGEETISPPTIPDDGLDLRGTFLDRRNEASPEGAA